MNSDSSNQKLIPAGDQCAGDSCCTSDQETVFPSARLLQCSATVFLLYFGARLLYLACAISPFVPPDEVSHFGICRVFATVPFLPENLPDSYQYGLVTNIPWLYYWIMGKLLFLNFTGIHDLVWLRLLNIPLAFGAVWYAGRTLRLLTDDLLTLLLLVVAMTNTMMFTFLSASVSYDNLANLLATMSVYYLLAFFRTREGSHLALCLICQLAGCLTKSSFLPLVPILLSLLLIKEIRQLSVLPGVLVRSLRGLRWRGTLLACLVLVGLVLNLQLYGGNYFRYGKLKLEMYDVLPFESVMHNSLSARNMILALFQDGRVTKEQAIAMSARIEHPGERIDTVTMVRNYEQFKTSGSPPMGLATYAALWTRRMAAGIFGVQGHLAMPANWPTAAALAFLGVLTLAGFIRSRRSWGAGGIPASLATIAGSYAIFLLYWVNYRGYLENGSFSLALQGRYLFPVIAPVYVLSSYYLMGLFNSRHLRMSVFAAAVLILAASDFPLFLVRVTPQWYVWLQN